MQVVAIIGAMDEEVTLIKNWMENIQQETIAGCEFYTGYWHGKSIVLLKSGIGKVNAAVSTTLLLTKYAPSMVINIGSAGGVDDALDVGDVVISNQVLHHDVDVTAFGYVLGQVPSMPARFVSNEALIHSAQSAISSLPHVSAKIGLIGTGDSFMNDPERVAGIKQMFPDLLAVEMEAAAVAQVCFKFETPFVVVRALSDIAGKESPKSFEEFLKVAAENSSLMIQAMLKDL